MNPSAEAFDPHVAKWAEWQVSPWGRLRYRLVAHTLDQAMSPLGARCHVLDVGGGDGADSVRLAEAGHSVTILDHSEPLLRRAHAAAEAAGVAERVRTVHADITCLSESGALGAAEGADRFDLVLCHNVLHYLTAEEEIIRRIVGMIRLGGVLSLLAPNPAMDVLGVAVRDTDPAAAYAVIDAPTVRSVTFDQEMHRLEPAAVDAMLGTYGCEVTHRFGIRCVSDLIANNELKADPQFSIDLERLELELLHREPYWRIARFWQLVARRTRA
jgi:S-adenosylmethionine-dependent methyltransferase